MDALTDLDVMPFGKWKGTLLQDVPANYFLWLYDEGGMWANPASPIKLYIEESWNALLKDCPNYEPKHKPK